ncbi:mitochondrial atpase [Ophiostoma piceae UAMH 11346]|uniref:ATPase inhibitor, mitochondrial n=1 Tax=Ophiostoma piceae (strain UAMH 11346) TaxID=1262450 RepID=S3BTY3_OPHP1|nr:mitochondrial atpase [Ophiostoma piceae UAMH 11346]
MLRQLTTVAHPASFSARTFATSAIRMSEGATGAPPKTGSPDAFQRRERANEDYTIRQREKEKLQQLKLKLKEQQAHLDQLAQHIDELTKEDEQK